MGGTDHRGYWRGVLRPGHRINDRYRLDEAIATGGTGHTWRAADETLGRTVAVKVLRPRHLDDDSGSRFLAEARAMAALLHPGVAAVYDYGQLRPDDGPTAAYIVMAWVDGPSLADRITEAGRLGAAETASIVSQVGRALQAVHDAGVVHGDVKPANLVVEPDGQVVLVDFGIAAAADAATVTAPHEVAGTALYRAPEQVAQRPLRPAADIYALGAVAYHCLAGHPPFPGDNATAVAIRQLQDQPPPLPDDVPANLRGLVATAMADDPHQRFPTAAAMADAAEATDRTDPRPPVVGASFPVAPAPAGAPSRRPDRRRTVLATASALLVALLAVLAVAAPLGMAQPPTDPSDPPSGTGSPTTSTTVAPGGVSGGGQTAAPAPGEAPQASDHPGPSPGRDVDPGPDGTGPPPDGADSGGTTTQPTDDPGSTAPDETPPPPEPTPAVTDVPAPSPQADEPSPTPSGTPAPSRRTSPAATTTRRASRPSRRRPG
jgi:serine/threonine-protein kinase